MTDNRIISLVNNFRERIDYAQSKKLFVNTVLEEFPVQCCGNASRLLAEFLRENGIETLWISSEEFGTDETHAWLVVKDDRINLPRSCYDGVPSNIMNLLSSYGGNKDSLSKATYYDAGDVEKGLIIDITGDQFGEPPVYVGYMDRFHRRFDFISAYEHEGLFDDELIELYQIITTQTIA